MDLMRIELAEHQVLLADYGLALKTLTTRIDEHEKVEGASPDFTPLKAYLTGLGRDVDQLNLDTSPGFGTERVADEVDEDNILEDGEEFAMKAQGQGIDEITQKRQNMEKEQHSDIDAHQMELNESPNKLNLAKNERSLDSNSQDRSPRRRSKR
uniref:Uncharacterized protein n=1 Tax=Solanum tuberosum TaxID=4113 RepID=M1DBE0_SOLTU